MRTAPDLSESQAFKNVSLQRMIDQTFTFRRLFFKKLHHIPVLTFDMMVKMEAVAYPFIIIIICLFHTQAASINSMKQGP